MGKTKSYNVTATFQRMSSAVEAVGVIKHKGVDDAPRVLGGDGQYIVVCGPFKARKTAEDVLAALHTQTTYTFNIE